MKLDIGCGRTWEKGWEGLDSFDFGQRFLFDLESGKEFGDTRMVTVVEDGKATSATQTIRIEDNSVEAIRMYNTLEHISRPSAIKVLNECWRVLQPGGEMEIITPDASKSFELAVQDPTHISFWIPGTFTQYICGGRPRNADYGIKKWKLIALEHDVPNEPRDMRIVMTPRK